MIGRVLSGLWDSAALPKNVGTQLVSTNPSPLALWAPLPCIIKDFVKLFLQERSLQSNKVG